MANGAEETITLEVRLSPGYTGNGSELVNIASVTATTSDPYLGNNQTEAPIAGGGAAEPEADLSLEKSFDIAEGEEVRPGQNVDVQLTATNNSPSVATDISAIDDLPQQLRFVGSSSACGEEESGFGGVVTCPEISSLDVDESYTWTFTVQLDPSFTEGDIENSALVSSAGTVDPNEENNSAQATISADQIGTVETDLALDKSVDLDSVYRTDEDGNPNLAPGDSFDFVITVTNLGPATARDITVVDTLPEELAVATNGLPDGWSAEGNTLTGPVADEIRCGRRRRTRIQSTPITPPPPVYPVARRPGRRLTSASRRSTPCQVTRSSQVRPSMPP